MLNLNLKLIARALATGQLLIVSEDKLSEISIAHEQALNRLKEDFDKIKTEKFLEYVEDKEEREPWRRGRPLK